METAENHISYFVGYPVVEILIRSLSVSANEVRTIVAGTLALIRLIILASRVTLSVVLLALTRLLVLVLLGALLIFLLIFRHFVPGGVIV